MAADVLTFAVCTFKRVFHPDPAPDALTLQELTTALQQFEVKPEVQQRIDKELARIEQAVAAWDRGDAIAGKAPGLIRRAAAAAEAAGEDPAAAVAAEAAKLTAEARRAAKKDLRLWAPTLYRPGTRRGKENVVHLSCVVLDYDDGTPLEEARAVWSPWFHVGHTTWSHRAERPRFRVCLPLAAPVRTEDWPAVWRWAEAHCGQPIDPACKGAARAWALPAIGAEDWPRAAWSVAGDLLDPVLEGIIEESAPPAEEPVWPGAEVSFFRSPERTAKRLVGAGDGATAPRPSAAALAASDDDDDLDFDAFGSGAVAGPPAPARAEPVGAGWTLDEIGELLLDLREQLGAGVALVSALERLVALREAGALSEEEFQRAKARVLDAG